MASSVLLLLALAAAPGAPGSTPAPSRSTASERSSTALVSEAGAGSVKAAAATSNTAQLATAGTASVKAAAMSNTGQLATAGTASVKAAAATSNTAQLATAGAASVKAAAGDDRAALAGAASGATRSAASALPGGSPANGGVMPASGTAAPGTSGVTHAAGTTATPASTSATPATGRTSAAPSTSAATPDAALPGTPSATPDTAAPAQGTTAPGPQSSTTPDARELSEAGRIAVDAGIAALRAAGLALKEGSGTTRGVASAADADAHYARGLEALKAKDTHTAVSELAACVDAVPSRADCRWELGWAYSVDNQWAEALKQWTEVQKLEPDHPDLETALAQARGQAALQARLALQGQEAAPRPPPPANAKLRLRATGDLMLGTTVPEGFLPPEGGGSVIANVRPLLEDADLTFVNLEGPLCDGGRTTKCRSPAHCYAFRSPTSFGQYLKEAGVDVASTANNHSGDFGEVCRRETEATLDAQGIAWSGPPGTVATLDRNGLRIGLVAFHTSPSCNHLNNLPTATALVRSVAATHDIVIVSFHGGAEGGKALHVPQGRELFFGEDRGDLRGFTHAVVDAGAHLVLGHGPHVARAMEFYKGRLIAYSMGNFATYGRFNLKGPQGLGMVLEVELDREGRFTTGRILPTKQVGEGIAMPDPDGGVIRQVRQLSNEDFPDTAARIADDGTLSPGKASLSSAGSSR